MPSAASKEKLEIHSSSDGGGCGGVDVVFFHAVDFVCCR